MEGIRERKVWIMVGLLIILAGLSLLVYQRTRTRVRGLTDDPRQERIDEPMVIVEEAESGETKEISMEEYVAGVVAGELKGKDWPENAFAAQAILARTFAMELMDREGGAISTDVEEAQAYDGQAITPTIRQAVKKTRGEVMLFADNYVRAWFHSNAGGHTTTAQVGLAFEKEEPPYIQPTISPDEKAPEEEKNWEARFSKLEILQVLQENGGGEWREITEIKRKEIDESGRPLDIQFFFENGDNQTLRAADFRILLGADDLLSTKIEEIEEDGEDFIFKGQGWGHGVGMSQWGAYSMAKEGVSPEEIVHYFFKGIDIVQVWN